MCIHQTLYYGTSISVLQREEKACINIVRAISSARLHVFRRLHLHPIDLVVSKGTYDLKGRDILSLSWLPT